MDSPSHQKPTPTKKDFKFYPGQMVLAYSTQLIYPAKIMRRKIVDGGLYYRVHYSGWNRGWDRWLPENKVRAYDIAGEKLAIQMQQSLEERLKEDLRDFKKRAKEKGKAAAEVKRFKYQAGDTLFCYFGDIPYKAKCIATKVLDGRPHFLVKYRGWNLNDNEWVQEERLLPFNKKNLKQVNLIHSEQKHELEWWPDAKFLPPSLRKRKAANEDNEDNQRVRRLRLAK